MRKVIYRYHHAASEDSGDVEGWLYVEAADKKVKIEASDTDGDLITMEVWPEIAREIAAGLNKAADDVEGKV